ncbi:MAG: hypothetical protein HYS13_08400 [Planctomycetia bacterium]|nr:hypothetical protein [Planctomycetia bacterium]
MFDLPPSSPTRCRIPRSQALLGKGAAVLALCLLLAGCRTNDQVRALEEENFQLCERITELEVELGQKDMQLDRLLGRSGGVQFDEGTYLDETPQPLQRPKTRSALPGKQSASPGVMTPPAVELGTPDEEKPGPVPQSSAPRSRPARTVKDVRTRPTGPVASLEVDAARSGGLDEDARPGDEGITLVLRAYDSSRRAIVPAGEVDVAVWDEVLLQRHASDPVARDSARVAVWKFEPQATAASAQADESGDSFLEFRLPWPQGRPQHDKLRVYVRMTCTDGRKLVVDAPISVSLSGRTAVRRDRSALTQNSKAIDAGAGPSPRSELSPQPADRSPLRDGDEAPIAKDAGSDRLTGGREETSAADSRAHRAQPKRPVWKPYR